MGGGEAQCAVCGAAVNSASGSRKPRSVVDGETMRFARAILDRPHKFTIIMLVANLFVFILMWQSSGLTSPALWEFPEDVLLAYGAKLNGLISVHHQWWRFITPMFVHVNLPHLLVNMYSLWMVGPYVEKLYGSAKFVVFWVVTGIAGVVASYLTVRPDAAVGPIGRFLFKAIDVPSAGASGALFGLVGVLFVFGLKFRHELPEGFKRAFGTGMLPIILINLFIGYLGRGFIDNAAHLGGLISGSILALAVDYRRPGERSGVTRAWQVLQATCIGLVAISFFLAYRNPPPASVLRQTVQLQREQIARYLSYVQPISEAQDAFYLGLKDGDFTNLDNAVKALDAAPHLDPESDELKEKLKALLIEVKTLGVPTGVSAKLDAKSVQEKHNALRDGFSAWKKEYDAWLKTNGRNHGGIEVIEASPR